MMHETAGPRSELIREHERIESTLRALEAARDPSSACASLDELHRQLETHFEREENAGGLLAAIGGNAVSLLPQVNLLFDEHRELATLIERLRERCQRLVAEEAEVRGESLALIERLRDHEQRESALFVTAVYTEHGGGD
jgi:hypothetical protein